MDYPDRRRRIRRRGHRPLNWPRRAERVLVIDKRPACRAATPTTGWMPPACWCTSTARTSSTRTARRSSSTSRASPRGGPTSTACWPCPMRAPAGVPDADQPHDDQPPVRPGASTRPASPPTWSGCESRASRSRTSRGRGAELGRPRPVREVLPRLHEEAVGPGPDAARRRRGRAHPHPHQRRRPLFHRPLPGHAGATATRRMFERLLDHPGIEVRTGTDYAADRWPVDDRRRTIFTGPIDEYYGHRFGRLPYRSLRFEHEHLAGRRAVPAGGHRELPERPRLHPHHRVQAPDRPGSTAGTSDRARDPGRRGRPLLPDPHARRTRRCSSATRRWHEAESDRRALHRAARAVPLLQHGPGGGRRADHQPPAGRGRRQGHRLSG